MLPAMPSGTHPADAPHPHLVAFALQGPLSHPNLRYHGFRSSQNTSTPEKTPHHAVKGLSYGPLKYAQGATVLGT